jgi:hypothetical protein
VVTRSAERFRHRYRTDHAGDRGEQPPRRTRSTTPSTTTGFGTAALRIGRRIGRRSYLSYDTLDSLQQALKLAPRITDFHRATPHAKFWMRSEL